MPRPRPSANRQRYSVLHTSTILRALRMLRDENVSEFRRGRGVTVAGQPERGIVAAQAQELLKLARQFGFARENSRR
jgi:GntR family transcriptional regulator